MCSRYCNENELALAVVVLLLLQAGCGVHSSIVKDAMTRAPVVNLPTAAQARYGMSVSHALITHGDWVKLALRTS